MSISIHFCGNIILKHIIYPYPCFEIEFLGKAIKPFTDVPPTQLVQFMTHSNTEEINRIADLLSLPQ